MSTFVQFGAGNIGRSFIGRQFFEAGYEVVFVDIDSRLIDLLNARRSYPVVTKQSGEADRVQTVEGVRAINGRDSAAVIAAIVDADCVATSVGQRALPSILQVLAQGLVARQAAGRPPLDVIIAENLRSGAELFRTTLKRYLPDGYALDAQVGLVETSIGKMVPIMPASALADDPLQLFSEPYDTLIVDRNGFRNPLPKLPGIHPVNNVNAYVDRKLFMHNMSHAAVAYLGYQADPSLRYIWQAMELPGVAESAGRALAESATALCAFYPNDLARDELDLHAADLLRRYRNRALGDTIYRVGRDLKRKLARNDRMIGACLLAARLGLPFAHIVVAAKAALGFRATDEQGQSHPADAEFLASIAALDARAALSLAADLQASDAIDRRVIEAI